MASKTFIVTGASRGLGLAITQLLLRDSHQVFLVARTESGLQKLKSENPSNVDYLAADLADFNVCTKTRS
jgi:short-subunit dehydrogenase